MLARADKSALSHLLHFAHIPLSLAVVWIGFAAGAETVHNLIDQMASPNKAPMIKWGEHGATKFTYPADYDYKAQERVEKRVQESWTSLLAKGTEAIPQLAGSVEDNRYSYTWPGSQGWNVSVGQECAEILQTEIEVYGHFVPREDERFTPHSVPGLGAPRGLQPKVFEKWWNEHKHSDLHALQTEAVQWAIEHERARRDLPQDEQSLVLSALEALLKRLKSSENPIRVNRKGEFLGCDAALFKEYRDKFDQLAEKQRAERLEEWEKEQKRGHH